jgi:peptide/nickel transport system substrate-binding protein
MATRKMTRREFLAASASGVASVVLAACTSTPPSTPAAATGAPAAAGPGAATAAPPAAAGSGATTAPAPAGAKSARGFLEPPFLADRVKSGKLPPIDQRLPEEVFVVGPGVLIQEEYATWQNGQYGGEIAIAPTFGSGFLNIAQSSTVLRSPSQTTKASKPNVVSAFSFSDDYTTYKFTLRKGLRWSDGEPVTTEDVRFAFEDLYKDPDVQRGWAAELYTQGSSALGPAELKIVDDTNFELKFSKPYGAFIAALNSWIPSYDIFIKPAHYLKQFHAKYAKKEDLDALLKKANETSWVKLITTKDVAHWDCGEIRALDMPVLNAWVLTEATDTRRVFERNPYFWHVDSDGHQLPYIDKVVNNISIDNKAQINAVMAGNVNLVGGNTIALSDMPVIVANAAKFGKRVFTTGSFNNPILLFLNHDFEYDKEGSFWQKLITDSQNRFGQAIAASMDPNEVNKSVYFGKYGKPFMNATGPDLAKANQLLDALGLDKKGSDGLRLGPDGQPFILRITHYNQAPDISPVAELLKAQIQKAGLRVEIEVVDSTLWDQRKTANQMMASLAWNDGPAWAGGISEDYLPNHKGPWSPMTWLYFTSNGKQGRKPPAYIQEFYDLHVSRKQYPPESDKGLEIWGKISQWLSDHYAMIPTAGPQIKPASVDAKLQNLPKEGSPFDLDVYINAESYWFAQA